MDTHVDNPICKNCKHYDPKKKTEGYCKNEENKEAAPVGEEFPTVDYDFSCYFIE